MSYSSPEVASLITSLRKDANLWNGFLTSFATSLQEWDATSEEDMNLIKENCTKLFPVKNSGYASAAYDIRESIIHKGKQTLKLLKDLRKNTSETLSVLRDYLDIHSNEIDFFSHESMITVLASLEDYSFSQMESFTLIYTIVTSLHHRIPQDTVQTYVLSLKYTHLQFPLESLVFYKHKQYQKST